MVKANQQLLEDIETIQSNIYRSLSSSNKQKAIDKFGSGVDNLDGKWEGHHLSDYVTRVRDRLKEEKKDANEKIFRAALKKAGIPGGLPWLQTLASARSIGDRPVKKLFKALTDVQGFDSTIECLLNFFKFCDDEGYQFAIFEYDSDKLAKVIKDIECYLNGDEYIEAEKIEADQKPKGLSIRYEKEIYEIEPVKRGVKALRIPNLSSNLDLGNVASLLDWEYRLTPFIGRTEECNRLKDWLKIEAPVSIKIIAGEGGVGKTRLASYFASQLTGQDWQAGHVSENFEGNWIVGDIGILMIIDYPEERQKSVRQLIRAMQGVANVDPSTRMPQLGYKVRLLFVTRNPDFAGTLVNRSTGLVFGDPIHLTALRKNMQFKLMKAAWKRLQDEDTQPSRPTPPVTSKELFTWIDQSKSEVTPLIIIALAVYLFKGGLKVKDQLLDISNFEVIRHLTISEVERIRSEIKTKVEDDSELSGIWPERFLLTKAVAAITGDLDDKSIRFLCNTLLRFGVDYPPVEPKYLRKSSLWVGGRLPTLKPDILAADFLTYCLQEYAIGQESEWMVAAIGFSSLQENAQLDNQKIAGRISKFLRNYYDATFKLGCSWQIAEIWQAIQNSHGFQAWVDSDSERSSRIKEYKPDEIKELFKEDQSRLSFIRQLWEFSDILGSLGNLEEQEKIRSQAVRECDLVIRENPNDFDFYLSREVFLRLLINDRLSLKKYEEVEEAYITSADGFRDLSRQPQTANPRPFEVDGRIRARHNLAQRLLKLGEWRIYLKKHKKSLRNFEDAISEFDYLIEFGRKEFPMDPYYGKSQAFLNVGEVYRILGREKKAEQALNSAVNAIDRGLEFAPGDAKLTSQKFRNLDIFAEFYFKAGRTKEACEKLEAARNVIINCPMPGRFAQEKLMFEFALQNLECEKYSIRLDRNT